MSYRIVVANLDSLAMEEIVPKNLQYSFKHNEAGTIDFTLPVHDPKCTRELLEPGQRELYVFKEQTKMWGGYLWNAGMSSNENTVRFSGEGFFSRLRRRHIFDTLSYVDIDQFDIAWNLIDYTQFQAYGDLGITRFSSADSGRARTRKYEGSEYKPISDALQELAAVNDGFDFEITADKEWKTYYPTKASGDVYTFELGKNVRGHATEFSAEDVRSEITAFGEGEGDNQLVSTEEDVDALEAFGLLQDTRSFNDVKNQATLNDHAAEELRLVKSLLVRPQLQVFGDDPPFGSYSAGDNARVIIDSGYTLIDTVLRITTISVQVSDAGFEAIGIYFDESVE